ncbi:MAG TPA: DUF2779 domain-containing protein [Gemmatimonadales bacterium]|nr:DUF2779 domain-containing protein [Gemmatimonadales bacterium]
MAETASPNLSKSRFVAGMQCVKLMWLRVHEKDAPELKLDPRLQDIITQGDEVGALAREQFPGGVMVDLPHDDPRREARTRELLASGAPAVFEATFVADRTFAAIDVLLREASGFTLIEVKSATSAHDKYLPDVAIQTHVARRSGIPIRRVEIMHLNGDYVHPGPNLFVRTDVTAKVEALLPDIPAAIAAQLDVLAHEEPEVTIGEHCRVPHECPFQSRCWPDDPLGVLTIHGMLYAKRFDLLQHGIRRIADLPANFKLNEVQRRQRKAVERGGLVIEPGLRAAMAPYAGRLGFLDFETVGRAIPRWNGTQPWQQIGVQFSYHERQADGSYTHAEYLAPSDCDPREEIATRLVEVTRNADRVVMYTPFERTQIRMMKQFVPRLVPELDALEAKLLDLKQVVHHHVYHPAFAGSFSIKDVLPALIPEMSYKDSVTILDGQEASAKLARLLFYAGELTEAEREQIKAELLAYCKYDTWAMVKLTERLSSLAGLTASAR